MFYTGFGLGILTSCFLVFVTLLLVRSFIAGPGSSDTASKIQGFVRKSKGKLKPKANDDQVAFWAEQDKTLEGKQDG